MFKNVLLPIDLNHEASWSKALPIAVELCGGQGTLHILGIVHDIGSAVVASYLPEGFEKHALEQMKEHLEEFKAGNVPGGVAAVTHVAHGHVPQKVLEAAGDAGADVIVMASHPPDELRTLLVGSYADKVVRHSPIPVMVVR